MSSTRIDDRASSVTYSQPASGHHWTSQGSSTSNANTLSLTRTRNAFASVTFTGSSIAVYGLISDSGVSDVAPVSSYAIDGGTAYTYTATQTSSVQSRVLFFKSDPLSNGQHTLVITNLTEGDFFWLDYFDVTPNTDNVATTTTTTNNPSQDSTTVLIHTLTTTFADASTTSTGVSTLISTSLISHSPVYSVSSSTPTGSTIQSEKKTQIPIAGIVGGIVGGVLLIIIVIFLLVCIKRRRKKKEGDIKLGPPSAWVPRQSGIVPFGVPVEPLNSTSQLHTAPSPSSTPYTYGGFNPQNMVSGRSAPIYGQVYPTPTPAVPQGKRQVTMPSDYSSTTGLVNVQGMGQDQLRANASSPSSSSGTTNPSRGWTVAGSTGISHSGSSDVARGTIYGGIQEEDSPPAYQANTGEGASASNHLAPMRKQ